VKSAGKGARNLKLLKPDYSGVFVVEDGVKRPMVLSDESALLVTKSGKRLSLRQALEYPDFECLSFDCPLLDEFDGYPSPLLKFLKEALI